MTPCTIAGENRRFRGTCCLHNQPIRSPQWECHLLLVSLQDRLLRGMSSELSWDSFIFPGNCGSRFLWNCEYAGAGTKHVWTFYIYFPSLFSNLFFNLLSLFFLFLSFLQSFCFIVVVFSFPALFSLFLPIRAAETVFGYQWKIFWAPARVDRLKVFTLNRKDWPSVAVTWS